MANANLICSIADCGKLSEKRGWCNTHYQRWRIHGDTAAVNKIPNGTCLQWLKDHVSHKGDDCLMWPFSIKSTGYAQLHFEGKPVHAHRVMCALVHGNPNGADIQAAHSCGAGHLGCVHPLHLRWATRSENLLEKRVHGTIPVGEQTGSAVLREAQVLEIAKNGAALSERSLAKMYGVHRSTINGILSGRSWSWLTGIGSLA